MSLRGITLVVMTSVLATGCASLASSTNMLSDEDIVSQTAGAIGYPPAEVTLVSRRTEGVNTYVELQTRDGKPYTCIVNGGNLLSMGMTNPPVCNKK
ncbi:hypothetical protein IP90_03122 [Luteimonas cucumeris]|uniref:Beta-barrel assembly machine subunit BamE n=1 Tax=Luteimonas cucumeris TaxID=985012 RepID=A0A562KW02_9GAMM|nr:hypothetical protein [Luteimonas cucumeris]TWH99383.1 hypothetical protein IP90_03122 [Luteimonas cucumeris]